MSDILVLTSGTVEQFASQVKGLEPFKSVIVSVFQDVSGNLAVQLMPGALSEAATAAGTPVKVEPVCNGRYPWKVATEIGGVRFEALATAVEVELMGYDVPQVQQDPAA